MNFLYVALGSAIGGVCRYGISHLVSKFYSGFFPLATFLVNIAGCLLIGFLFGCVDRSLNLNASVRLFLITGFCGGFTTFSTFAHENYLLFENERGVLIVVFYAAVSFFMGLLMVYVGHRLSEII